MASMNRRWVMLVVLVALSDVVLAIPFNITEILAPYPDFRTFNSLLSSTKVSALINSRQTITVLALDNRAIAPILHQPLDNIARILMVHVLLDYFSIPKLRDLRQETTVTDLLQTTGVAEGHQGFVVLNRSSSGHIMFRAAGQKEQSSTLLEEVFKLPYNISVLRVNAVIIAPGMITRDQPYAPLPLVPAGSPAPTQAPLAPTPAHAPSISHAPAHAPTPAPAAEDSSPPPKPEVPPPAEGGDGDDADAPESDGDVEGPTDSGAWMGMVGVAVAVAVSCLVSLMIGA